VADLPQDEGINSKTYGGKMGKSVPQHTSTGKGYGSGRKRILQSPPKTGLSLEGEKPPLGWVHVNMVKQGHITHVMIGF